MPTSTVRVPEGLLEGPREGLLEGVLAADDESLPPAAAR
jgi:hypothetical protein